MDPSVAFYGFTPVARDPDVLFDGHPTASGDNPKRDPFTLADFPLPSSPLVQEVVKFARKELTEQIFNHSHRIYIYGLALTRTHFPTWTFDHETFFLTCMLHDIGLAERFLASTKLSFELKGGIVARELILGLGGVEDQADGVCDAIVRHQDVFDKGGNITMMGQVLQLSWTVDNVGLRANLVHPLLIEETCAKYPRMGWTEHFASSIEKEQNLKPWCHSSVFECPAWKPGMPSDFAATVRGNKVMKAYD